MSWRRRVEPLVRPLFHARMSMSRGLTLGVRGLVTDAEGRVLLIEHTYVPGWHMPGGGVERGEPAETALARELLEEAGVVLIERPRLVSIHDHGRTHRHDHVLLYRCGAYELTAPTSKHEILAMGWFALDDLPAQTTPATRARLQEALQGAPASPFW